MRLYFLNVQKCGFWGKCWKKRDFSILNHVVASGVLRTDDVNLWLKSLKKMRHLSEFEWKSDFRLKTQISECKNMLSRCCWIDVFINKINEKPFNKSALSICAKEKMIIERLAAPQRTLGTPEPQFPPGKRGRNQKVWKTFAWGRFFCMHDDQRWSSFPCFY